MNLQKSTWVRVAGVVVGLLFGAAILFIPGMPLTWVPVVLCGVGGYAIAEVVDRKMKISEKECDAVDPWKQPDKTDGQDAS